jgi:hypothetical protein
MPNLSKHITENLVDSTTTQLTALSTVTAAHKYQQTAPTVQPTSTMTSDLKRKWLSNDELLSEIMGEIHPPPKKRRAIKKKPAILPPSNEPSHVDNTTFPFLNLLGEIRNMIYTYADLIDEDHSIRFDTQTGRNGRNTVCRMFRARPRRPPRAAQRQHHQSLHLVPALVGHTADELPRALVPSVQADQQRGIIYLLRRQYVCLRGHTATPHFFVALPSPRPITSHARSRVRWRQPLHARHVYRRKRIV